jgi:hypothetical protein
MLWFIIFTMVILKLPIAYLAYVMWWSIKDAPDTAPGGFADDGGGPGPRRGPRLGLRGGPHGTRAGRRRTPAHSRAASA